MLRLGKVDAVGYVLVANAKLLLETAGIVTPPEVVEKEEKTGDKEGQGDDG